MHLLPMKWIETCLVVVSSSAIRMLSVASSMILHFRLAIVFPDRTRSYVMALRPLVPTAHNRCRCYPRMASQRPRLLRRT
jgi:hypothetical protein